MIAGPSAAHSFSMNGPIKIYGNGENFSIYGTLEGNGAIGRKEYEILYVVSGRQVITGIGDDRKYEIKELQYAYVVLWNETSNSFRGVEDAGTFCISKPMDAETYRYNPL